MEYKIQQVCVDEKSLVEIKDLLTVTFPKTDKFTSSYLRWQYKENPLGHIVGFNAYWGSELAAHYVTMPIDMHLFGEKKRGLLSLNTATHPKHQGKRLFTILAEKTFSWAKEHGYEYVIGVANANSTHGFLKHLGFYLISPLVVKWGWGYELYKKSSYPCCRIWNESTLQWRLKNPSSKYYVNHGIITSPKGFSGVKVIVGKNSLAQGNKPASFFRPLNLYVGLGANLSCGHYFDVPKFIKHSPFNLIFKNLSDTIPPIHREDVFFQLLDFDVI